MTSDFSHLLDFLPDAEPAPEQAPEDAPESVESDTVAHTAATAAVAADFAREQARQLDAQLQEYMDRLPAIHYAQPLQPTASESAQPSRAEWIAQGVDQALSDAPDGYTVRVQYTPAEVSARITVPAGVDAVDSAGPKLARRLAKRGNLGTFEVIADPDPLVVHLVREGIGGPGVAWRGHGQRAGNFYADRDSQWRIFELAKLTAVAGDGARTVAPRVHSWGEDSRGGTCELRLPPGMLLGQVQAAEPALRQALNAPHLTVSSRGVYPVIHLNSKQISREFPKMNPLYPGLFVRPRTQAERVAAADDFVLPLGIRADGSPILIRQSVAPHTAIFGGTGQGKTMLLSQMVRAAVLQGGEVVLADAKNGKDFRALALAGLPGVVHYSAGSEAGLHRAVLMIRDEFERRRTLAAELQRRGVEYRPTPLLLVFDEVGAWLDDQLSGSDKEAKRAAEQTLAHLSYVAAQAREQKCFLLVAGQHAYVSAFSGRWRSNTSTLVVLGPPTENHRAALFSAGEQRDQVRDLGATISKSMKGRGLVADTETGEVALFQGFYNEPGSEAATAFDAALTVTPRLRRFAWRFPTAGEPGSDGSWQDWTPVSDRSSDSLETVYLDGPDSVQDPAMAIYDPTSPRYSPGVRPLRSQHQHRDSYDN